MPEENIQDNKIEEKTEKNGIKRNEDGTFAEGTAPGPGRPLDTKEDVIVKRAIKELIKEYKEDLAQVLPQIKPVIISKALEGDMTAIKEIHDRVMDKSKQSTDITSGGEKIIPIFNGQSLQNNNGDQKDISTSEEDKSSSGWNIGE